MGTKKGEDKKPGQVSAAAIAIIVGVAVTFIGGASSPWWWPKAFPKESATSQTNQASNGANSQNISTGNNSPVTFNQTVNNYLEDPKSKAYSEKERLRTRYDMGYAVFAVDDTEIHPTRHQNFENELQVDWTRAAIVGVHPDSVEIILPDITSKTTGAPLLVGTTTILGKRIGVHEGLVSMGIYSVETEVIDVQAGFIVGVVGVRSGKLK